MLKCKQLQEQPSTLQAQSAYGLILGDETKYGKKPHGGAAEVLQRLFSYDVGKIRVGYGEDGCFASPIYGGGDKWTAENFTPAFPTKYASQVLSKLSGKPENNRTNLAGDTKNHLMPGRDCYATVEASKLD
ncbi:hypothetical protein GEV33_004860 [Tenebrio molitor]|uniref:Uncharacterized protein n=1 Tax=Tenebrio molitor TaxID=7067 RepID=A0A8J6HPZ3_TENMO|nr:hypothetical protein GEV33_004860 [Tenebrio molitor]